MLTNLPDRASAEALAAKLVERRLAACVNIVPGVVSVYTPLIRMATGTVSTRRNTRC